METLSIGVGLLALAGLIMFGVAFLHDWAEGAQTDRIQAGIREIDDELDRLNK